MQLGWIDFSKTERSKILSVLDLLQERGTLDELGIAPVRDGFANFFFPGTSTIQTRAKYFLIVPYAMKTLERSGDTNPGSVLRALDEIEKECCEIFDHQNSGEKGIIGKQSLKHKRWVQRNPSDIYWSGLKQYGIFVGGNFSLTEYVRTFCALKNSRDSLKSLGNSNDNNEKIDYDDKDAGDLFSMQFWNIPTYRQNWMDSLTMALTSAEAKFLKKKITDSQKNTMLAHILQNNMTEVLDCESFEDLESIIHKFPDIMQQDYYMALDFSRLLYIIRVVYNIIVSDGSNEEANAEYARLSPNFGVLADIDLDRIFDRLGIFTNTTLVSFLNQVKEHILRGDMDSLRKCIKDREVFLKGTSRAKTAHQGEFDPAVWFSGRMLDYRFTNAKAIIRDIFEGEVSDDAKPE